MTAISLGRNLIGGQLSKLPPDSSVPDLVAALNSIIDKLNTWNGVIVQQGTIGVPVTAAPTNFTTVPHNLGYVPTVEASLNNVGIGAVGGSNSTLTLPTFIDAAFSGGNVVFQSYMFAFADSVNLYIYTINATGADHGTFEVTYLLKRYNANQS